MFVARNSTVPWPPPAASAPPPPDKLAFGLALHLRETFWIIFPMRAAGSLQQPFSHENRENPPRVSLSRLAECVQHDVSVQWRLVRVVNSCEIPDLPTPSRRIHPLGIPFLADLQWRVHICQHKTT